MRRAGYATVDALVARLADPGADPVLRRADAADMRARLGGPAPEQPGDYGAVLARVLADVLPYAARTDHPGYLAFIPSFTTWPAALAELTAAAAIQRNLELAEYAEGLIQGRPELTLMAPATLGIVCFRREWPGCDRPRPSAVARRSPMNWSAAAPRWSPLPGWPGGTPSGSAS